MKMHNESGHGPQGDQKSASLLNEKIERFISTVLKVALLPLHHRTPMFVHEYLTYHPVA